MTRRGGRGLPALRGRMPVMRGMLVAGGTRSLPGLVGLAVLGQRRHIDLRQRSRLLLGRQDLLDRGIRIRFPLGERGDVHLKIRRHIHLEHSGLIRLGSQILICGQRIGVCLRGRSAAVMRRVPVVRGMPVVGRVPVMGGVLMVGGGVFGPGFGSLLALGPSVFIRPGQRLIPLPGFRLCLG